MKALTYIASFLAGFSLAQIRRQHAVTVLRGFKPAINTKLIGVISAEQIGALNFQYETCLSVLSARGFFPFNNI